MNVASSFVLNHVSMNCCLNSLVYVLLAMHGTSVVDNSTATQSLSTPRSASSCSACQEGTRSVTKAAGLRCQEGARSVPLVLAETGELGPLDIQLFAPERPGEVG